jgi:hypothetical protein
MVNTRNSQCNGRPNNTNKPINLEQLIATQNNLIQVILQTLNNMQPHKQQAPPPPLPHQSHLVEFLRTRPTISQAKDPMEGEDWLKEIEKKLVITQYIDRKFFLLHTSSLGRQQIGGRRTATLTQTSIQFPYQLCAPWHYEVEGVC